MSPVRAISRQHLGLGNRQRTGD